MLGTIIKWMVFALFIIFTAWIVPGISVDNFFAAMLACLVVALINVFIRPVLEFISLPISFLTLGLFSFVINALLLLLAGAVTPGFEVEGFWSAVLGSVLLALFAGIVNRIKV